MVWCGVVWYGVVWCGVVWCVRVSVCGVVCVVWCVSCGWGVGVQVSHIVTLTLTLALTLARPQNTYMGILEATELTAVTKYNCHIFVQLRDTKVGLGNLAHTHTHTHPPPHTHSPTPTGPGPLGPVYRGQCQGPCLSLLQPRWVCFYYAWGFV